MQPQAQPSECPQHHGGGDERTSHHTLSVPGLCWGLVPKRLWSPKKRPLGRGGEAKGGGNSKFPSRERLHTILGTEKKQVGEGWGEGVGPDHAGPWNPCCPQDPAPLLPTSRILAGPGGQSPPSPWCSGKHETQGPRSQEQSREKAARDGGVQDQVGPGQGRRSERPTSSLQNKCQAPGAPVCSAESGPHHSPAGQNHYPPGAGAQRGSARLQVGNPSGRGFLARRGLSDLSRLTQVSDPRAQPVSGPPLGQWTRKPRQERLDSPARGKALVARHGPALTSPWAQAQALSCWGSLPGCRSHHG